LRDAWWFLVRCRTPTSVQSAASALATTPTLTASARFLWRLQTEFFHFFLRHSHTNQLGFR
jgi:hypothetical protein